MTKTYLLEWLDQLITVRLTPSQNNVGAICPEEAGALHREIKAFLSAFPTQINAAVLSLDHEKKGKLTVRNYHAALLHLHGEVARKASDSFFSPPHLGKVLEELRNGLDGLLYFMENRFAGYLGSNTPVPSSYYYKIQVQLLRRLDRIGQRLERDGTAIQVCAIVLENLHAYFQKDYNTTITFKALWYRKMLIKGLERVTYLPVADRAAALDDLLLDANFNSSAYLKLLTAQLEHDIESQQTTSLKMERLWNHFKRLNHRVSKKGMALSADRKSLIHHLRSWFRSERLYLKMVAGQASTTPPALPASREKVLCGLSTDQLALILRAADESRLLLSKSMNEVFRTIVPHLSTTHKDDLSYSSVRSKAYIAEERDKEIAVAALEKLIRKIKAY